MKIMDKSVKTMENSIKTMEQILIPVEKWWTVRRKDFSYKMKQVRDLAAKTKEGSLDDKKQNANLIPPPILFCMFS